VLAKGYRVKRRAARPPLYWRPSFLDHLSRYGNVGMACKHAAISRWQMDARCKPLQIESVVAMRRPAEKALGADVTRCYAGATHDRFAA